MRDQGLLIGNYAAFALIGLALATLQSSLWMQVFGSFPAPHLWLPIAIYWSIYRKPQEGILICYVLSIAIAPLTAAPMGILLLLLLILWGCVYVFKRRIFWPGTTYFMLVVGAATLALPILHFILSWIFERNPTSSFYFFEWIMKSLLTPLVSIPLLVLFQKIDMLTHKEIPTETGATIL